MALPPPALPDAFMMLPDRLSRLNARVHDLETSIGTRFHEHASDTVPTIAATLISSQEPKLKEQDERIAALQATFGKTCAQTPRASVPSHRGPGGWPR